MLTETPDVATDTTRAGGSAGPEGQAQGIAKIINHIPSMVAYWDANERCAFANAAYLEWFGRTPREMTGISLKELLGPIYERNLPYIRGALRGEKQVFERQITLPGGEVRDSIATYTPDVADGRVLGFSVVVSDVTPLRRAQRDLEEALRTAIEVLEKSKRSFRSKELGRLRYQLLGVQQARAPRFQPGPTATPDSQG